MNEFMVSMIGRGIYPRMEVLDNSTKREGERYNMKISKAQEI